MAFFLGTKGNIRLRRGSRNILGGVKDVIDTNDINTSLNRIGLEHALENIFTGDRIQITTSDPRGLVCFPSATWANNVVNNGIAAYVNINAAGGLRFFQTFQDAVNNTRANELSVTTFAGGPIPIEFHVRDTDFNILGNVLSYEFNTTRDLIDASVLDDRFRQQLSAGLLSGSGRIDCAFDYSPCGVSETPLFMLQMINRVEIGSEFDLALYLTDKDVDPNVETIFYLVAAVVTRSGMQAKAGDIIDCSIDFVTSGDIRLVIGKPSDYLLADDGVRIQLEQSLDFLLEEDVD